MESLPLLWSLLWLVATSGSARGDSPSEREARAALRPYERPRCFDYLVLTLRSRAAVCTTAGRRCPAPPRTASDLPLWTIQDLRPAWFNGSTGPTSCWNATFRRDDVKLLRRDLDRLWPSYTADRHGNQSRDADERLWADSLSKFGSCILCQNATTRPPMSASVRYFTLALRKANTYRVDRLLADYGITPNNSTPQLLARVQMAIEQRSGGGSVHLGCQQRRYNRYVLETIEICFDRWNEPTVCSNTNPSCLSPRVWYLAHSGGAASPHWIGDFTQPKRLLHLLVMAASTALSLLLAYDLTSSS